MQPTWHEPGDRSQARQMQRGERKENTMNSKNNTRTEQVKSYEAWVEYVDPQGVVTEKQWRRMSTEKKMKIIKKVFGKEVPA